MTQLDSSAATTDAAATEPQRPIRQRRRLGRRGVVVLVGALVLVLAGVGFGAWALLLEPDATAAPQYRTLTVSKGTITSTVSATGTLDPARESALSFRSSGDVTTVSVEVGDTVGKGDVLARIDDTELEIDVEAARAELAESEDALAALEDDPDATDTAIASATATVRVRKNAVTQAEAALDDATLVAPFSGTIAAVGLAKGDTVGSSSAGSAGSAGSSTSGSGASSAAGTSTSDGSSGSITLISTGRFVVTTSVSTADLAAMKKGLQATITPTGSKDSVFGTVSSIGVVATAADSGTSTSGSSTFPVTITVTGRHPELLPGSSADVRITTRQLADVISVPTQAVSTADGKTVVQKLVDGAQVPTEVAIGQVVGASTVITKGLADGDEIVVASFTARNGTGQQSQNGGFGGTGLPPGMDGTGTGQGGPPVGGPVGTGQGGTGQGGTGQGGTGVGQR
ncbi:MAG TPA: biotin/lipoyl-binding protein [Microlunatus sp.]|nr:biotin/lipoyl-binding protein [Microlunatus sp.]